MRITSMMVKSGFALFEKKIIQDFSELLCIEITVLLHYCVPIYFKSDVVN